MSGLLPPNVLSYEGQVVVPFINRTTDPTTSNYQFNVPTIWVNTASEKGFILLGKPMNVAFWFPFAGGTVVTESLVGNSGGAVPPTANKINVLGDGTFITTVGNPGTSTLTIEPAGGLTTLYTENTGTAVASAGNLNIVGGTGISTTGSGNTITIALSGSGPAIEAINVDAHTAPGTSPVVPSGGAITVTGGQIAAGTTTHVIRTDSLAANTYTIEVQRSQAVGSSTIGDNGVCHFNSANFSVDANGFVSLSSAFDAIAIQTFTTSGTYTPTSGMKYCIIEVVGGGGGGGGVASTTNMAVGSGGGGGSGGYSRGVFSAATIGISQTVTVGAGGTGGNGGAGAGGTGGTTSVGILISATGGGGGQNNNLTGTFVATNGGTPGTGSGGSLNVTSAPGNTGFGILTSGSVYMAFSGIGGSSIYGGGGQSFQQAGLPGAASGINANGFGGGGGGAASGVSGAGANGGAGAAGVVVITEYIL